MPEQPNKTTPEIYLNSPFGRERWIADRYKLPFDRVKFAFQAMDLCDFAGSAEITAEMLKDWPPPLNQPGKTKNKLGPPELSASPPARVIRTWDFGRSSVKSNDPRIKAAVARVLEIEARRAKVHLVCCSFCGKELVRDGTMLETQDWQHPDRLVRICRDCAEMACALIDCDVDTQANMPEPSTLQ